MLCCAVQMGSVEVKFGWDAGRGYPVLCDSLTGYKTGLVCAAR
jgi:hypothetical protein